jgi:hypothetical protein
LRGGRLWGGPVPGSSRACRHGIESDAVVLNDECSTLVSADKGPTSSVALLWPSSCPCALRDRCLRSRKHWSIRSLSLRALSLRSPCTAVEWGSDRSLTSINQKATSFVRLAGDPDKGVEHGLMAHSLRSLGSAALNFAMVAQGGMDIYWHVSLTPDYYAPMCNESFSSTLQGDRLLVCVRIHPQ